MPHHRVIAAGCAMLRWSCVFLMAVVFVLSFSAPMHAEEDPNKPEHIPHNNADQNPPAVEVEIPLPEIVGEDFDFAAGALDESRSTERPPLPPPSSSVAAGAYIISWENYRTLIAIENTAGLVKGCWIVTLATKAEEVPSRRGVVSIARGQVVVAYRGYIYADKNGTVHANAQQAKLTGVLWDNWSPDSFSIAPDKSVLTQDDDPRHPTNKGVIEKKVLAHDNPAEYRKLLYVAQSIINGTL
jgi:hypothetical protein